MVDLDETQLHNVVGRLLVGEYLWGRIAELNRSLTSTSSVKSRPRLPLGIPSRNNGSRTLKLPHLPQAYDLDLNKARSQLHLTNVDLSVSCNALSLPHIANLCDLCSGLLESEFCGEQA